MTISPQSSGRSASARRGSRVVWLLASVAIGACSLIAPDDPHYLSGAPPANGGGGEGGEATGDSGAAGASGSRARGGDGGAAGSDAGAANGGEAALICRDDLADCNGVADDGCEVDLSASHENCGGCGKAFACTADQACELGACISLSGCSDGGREGFLPIDAYPRLAGCTAKWPRGSLRAAKTGAACGFALALCAVPADACGAGWHVCASPGYGPKEVSEQASAEECAARPGAFAAAVGDQFCEPCSDSSDGAACCGDGCVQQYGNCIYPGMTAWFGTINGYKNVCGAIESNFDGRGVLCCRAPRGVSAHAKP